MKKLDSYILSSVLKIGFVTLMMCSVMLVLFDLFSNISEYLELKLSFFAIAKLSLMALPDGIGLALGPSMLFATTYFISTLYANNELICILNSGIPYRRIVAPIIVSSLFLAAGMFAFNEGVAIPMVEIKEQYKNELFSRSATKNYDNAHVTLNDWENGMVISVQRYIDKKAEILGVVLIFRDEKGNLTRRVNASSGVYDSENGCWILENTKDYIVGENEVTLITDAGKRAIAEFNTEPEMFRNISNDIKTMELGQAASYLRKLKKLSPTQYAQNASEFFERIYSPLTVFIMMIISCSINLKFKKNVLLFSIICSLCVAVVYYVVQMVTLIMAKQGIIMPQMGMLIPMIMILIFAAVSASTIRT